MVDCLSAVEFIPLGKPGGSYYVETKRLLQIGRFYTHRIRIRLHNGYRWPLLRGRSHTVLTNVVIKTEINNFLRTKLILANAVAWDFNPNMTLNIGFVTFLFIYLLMYYFYL
jgi:hypothetical protein